MISIIQIQLLVHSPGWFGRTGLGVPDVIITLSSSTSESGASTDFELSSDGNWDTSLTSCEVLDWPESLHGAGVGDPKVIMLPFNGFSEVALFACLHFSVVLMDVVSSSNLHVYRTSKP